MLCYSFGEEKNTWQLAIDVLNGSYVWCGSVCCHPLVYIITPLFIHYQVIMLLDYICFGAGYGCSIGYIVAL